MPDPRPLDQRKIVLARRGTSIGSIAMTSVPSASSVIAASVSIDRLLTRTRSRMPMRSATEPEPGQRCPAAIVKRDPEHAERASSRSFSSRAYATPSTMPNRNPGEMPASRDTSTESATMSSAAGIGG